MCAQHTWTTGGWSQGLAQVFPQAAGAHGARGGRPSLGLGSRVCVACLCGRAGLLAGEQQEGFLGFGDAEAQADPARVHPALGRCGSCGQPQGSATHPGRQHQPALGPGTIMLLGGGFLFVS